MALNGTIDAAVAGGVSQLVEIFLTPEFVENNRDKISHVLKLKQMLKRQADILAEGLQVHKKLAPENMLALHSKLEGKLKQVVLIWGALFEKWKADAKIDEELKLAEPSR